MASNNYIPGTCNIGGSELTRRKRIAILLFILSMVLSGFYYIRAHSDYLVLVLVFGFWAATSVSLLQVLNKFCVRYGLGGSFNFGANGQSGRTRNAEFIATDRRKTFLMLIQATLISAVITGAVFFVSFISNNLK